MDERTTDVTAGLRQLEGYLLWQAELSTVQRDADAFAGLLTWLTDGQREEVVRAYVEERLRVSRHTATRVAQRCRELRGEYEERYRRLSSRLMALFLAGVVVEVVVCALLMR
jgi:hypothetical protein